MGHGTTGAGDVVMGRGYRFDSFLLDVERGALLGDGEEIALRPKSFDVFHYLVRHPQRLVSRDELLKAAWPGVVVTDDSLTQCLIEVRKALGDDDRTGRVPGKLGATGSPPGRRSRCCRLRT